MIKKARNVLCVYLPPKCGHSEMEHFVKELEKNLKEAVKGLTPLKVLCTVLVKECFFLTSKRYHNEYHVRTEYNSLKVKSSFFLDFSWVLLSSQEN